MTHHITKQRKYLTFEAISSESMKHIFTYTFLLIASVWQVNAQSSSGNEAFPFLRLPASARVTALGGTNVSIVEPDPSLAFNNPALLGAELAGMLQVGYMNFFGNINSGSAIYSGAMKDGKGAWAVGGRYFSYGNMKAADPEGMITGSFSANDISLEALYSRDLSERWRGGIALQFLYSSIERYNSVGLAVDAGLSYYDADNAFSAALALRSVGAQLKAYNEKRYPLPWDIQAGFSKRLAHAPIRISITALNLSRWNIGWAEHFAAGVDFIPTDNVWIGLGYNPQAAADMKLTGGGNGLGGFSVGGGLRIKTIAFDVAVARYHPSAISVMLNLSVPVTK
jgi:hypothetical protein